MQYRIDTFSTKEPETLDWIDGFSQDSIMWDIGANVGLYSCYAAKARATKVFAFEPSIFNLESLARNIHINDLAASVVIIPLPLADKLTINKMCMTSTDWGEALSTFGADFGFDGKPLNNIFSFSTIGLSMDEANLLLKIPRPDYIKMDVDGLEHLILSGGLGMLSTVKSVLVEINDDFLKQAQDSLSYLMSSGLQMVDKRRWDGVRNSPFQNTYNQIWKRSSIE